MIRVAYLVMQIILRIIATHHKTRTKTRIQITDARGETLADPTQVKDAQLQVTAATSRKNSSSTK